MIDRRRFLLGLSSAAGLTACAARPPERGQLRAAELHIDSGQRLATALHEPGVGAQALGLSFESAQLADAHWFAPENSAFVQLLRQLVPRGCLRIGGESSAYTQWQRRPQALAAPYRQVLTPTDIERFAAFLEACDWRVVYGLDLAHGDPERAADEAAYVAKRLGSRLEAFQIGHEPDLYERRGLRPSGYDVNAFIDEWQRYAQALRARLGEVPLAGPDVAYRRDWLERFAERCGTQLRFVSDHYYALGPASDPDLDIARLILSPRERPDTVRKTAQRLAGGALPYRLTECNSVWGGGKAGVSDTFATALWAIDFIYEALADGWSGVYFHGSADAVYSPILRAAGQPAAVQAQPLYYGLLFAAQALQGRHAQRIATRLQSANRLLRSYATLDADSRLRVVLMNPTQANAIDVRIRADRPLVQGRALRLNGATLFNKSGITLGGGSIGDDGRWTPGAGEAVASEDGAAFITVPTAGAVLLEFA